MRSVANLLEASPDGIVVPRAEWFTDGSRHERRAHIIALPALAGVG